MLTTTVAVEVRQTRKASAPKGRASDGYPRPSCSHRGQGQGQRPRVRRRGQHHPTTARTGAGRPGSSHPPEPTAIEDPADHQPVGQGMGGGAEIDKRTYQFVAAQESATMVADSCRYA